MNDLHLFPVDPVRKACGSCGEMKELDEFHRHPSNAFKRQQVCKQCTQNDPERKRRMAERQTRDQIENPDKYRDRYLRKTYGITIEDERRMLEAQDYRCAVCRNPFDKMHVDHDHLTGQVRGMLCIKCNMGLGMFQEDPAALRAAADYLESFSIVLGITTPEDLIAMGVPGIEKLVHEYEADMASTRHPTVTSRFDGKPAPA